MTARSGCSSGMCTCKKKKGEDLDLKVPKHPQRDESSQTEAEPARNELVPIGKEEDTPGKRCEEHELSLLIQSVSVYIACLSCVHSRNRRWRYCLNKSLWRLAGQAHGVSWMNWRMARASSPGWSSGMR